MAATKGKTGKASLKGAVRDAGRSIRRGLKAIEGGVTLDAGRMYSYETKADREATVKYWMDLAITERKSQEAIWSRNERYYNSARTEAQAETSEAVEEMDVPTPAIVPEAQIHVDSQLTIETPDFQFRPNDNLQDPTKARQRQHAVEFILRNNEMERMNVNNELRLGQLGDAYWKVYFDPDKACGQYEGDIGIADVSCWEILSDPNGIDFDEKEFHDHVYQMANVQIMRKYAYELGKIKISRVEDLGADPYTNTGLAGKETLNSATTQRQDYTSTVVEHYFKWPMAGQMTVKRMKDGRELSETVQWDAGDIGMTTVIRGTEVRFAPLFWRRTHKQNKMYPILKYSRMPKADEYWGRGDVEPIISLMDAVNRLIQTLQLNDDFMANDMVIVDKGALEDPDYEVKNAPGEVVYIKDGRQNAVARLGNLSNAHEGIKATIEFYRDIIKQTEGNYDINMGDAPPSNVNTLGGLLTMKDIGEVRQLLKKTCRNAGFKRLYTLLDYMAIEFYDEDRLIYIGADEPTTTAQAAPGANAENLDISKGPIRFTYNSEKMHVKVKRQGEDIKYWPGVDCIIDIGDGIKHSTALTVQFLQTLAGMNVTEQNWLPVCMLIDKAGMPDGKQLREFYEKQFKPVEQPPAQTPGAGSDFASMLTPEELQHLKENPQLLQQMIAQHLAQNPASIPGITPEEIAAIQADPSMLERLIGQQGGSEGEEQPMEGEGEQAGEEEER